MSFLRAKQRTITALSPHPGNPTHLIPSRPIAQFETGRKFLLFAGDTVITVDSFALDSGKVNKITYGMRLDVVAGLNQGIWGLVITSTATYARFRTGAKDIRAQREGIGGNLTTLLPAVGTVYFPEEDVSVPGTVNYTLADGQSESVTVRDNSVGTGLLIGEDGESGFWIGIIADFKVFDAVGFLQNHWPIDDDVIDGGTIVDVAGGQDGILTLGAGEWLDSPALP